MAHPERNSMLEVAPQVASSDLVGRVLAALPALCFVHCVGSVLLALALPAAASLWSAGDWLEGPLWLVSLLVVGVMLFRRGTGRGGAAVLFGMAVVAGVLGFVRDVELAKRASLLLLVGVQVFSWRLQRKLVMAPVCTCHGHHMTA